MTDFSPPVEISTILTGQPDVHLHVVREDLLPGGTKQRAIIPFLRELIDQGHDEFVYSSPFCGFAQVALAFAGQTLGQKVTLFCETVPSSEGPTFHPLSRLAESMGAEIRPAPTLREACELATAYATRRPRTLELPLGFNHPIFLRHYALALEDQFAILCEKIGVCPKIMWLPVGSGTLTRLFRQVLPKEVQLKCVDVRVLDPDDDRIRQIEFLDNTQLFRADLEFHEESKEIPPLPSNLFYDAKLWRFLDKQALNHDVWWNVAR